MSCKFLLPGWISKHGAKAAYENIEPFFLTILEHMATSPNPGGI